MQFSTLALTVEGVSDKEPLDQVADLAKVKAKALIDLRPAEKKGAKVIMVVHGSGSGGKVRVRRIGVQTWDGSIISFSGPKLSPTRMQPGNTWYNAVVEKVLGDLEQ